MKATRVRDSACNEAIRRYRHRPHHRRRRRRPGFHRRHLHLLRRLARDKVEVEERHGESKIMHTVPC